MAVSAIGAVVKQLREPFTPETGGAWAKKLVVLLREMNAKVEATYPKAGGVGGTNAGIHTLCGRAVGSGTKLVRAILGKELPEVQKARRASFTRALVVFLKTVQATQDSPADAPAPAKGTTGLARSNPDVAAAERAAAEQKAATEWGAASKALAEKSVTERPPRLAEEEAAVQSEEQQAPAVSLSDSEMKKLTRGDWHHTEQKALFSDLRALPTSVSSLDDGRAQLRGLAELEKRIRALMAAGQDVAELQDLFEDNRRSIAACLKRLKTAAPPKGDTHDSEHHALLSELRALPTTVSGKEEGRAHLHALKSLDQRIQRRKAAGWDVTELQALWEGNKGSIAACLKSPRFSGGSVSPAVAAAEAGATLECMDISSITSKLNSPPPAKRPPAFPLPPPDQESLGGDGGKAPPNDPLPVRDRESQIAGAAGAGREPPGRLPDRDRESHFMGHAPPAGPLPLRDRESRVRGFGEAVPERPPCPYGAACAELDPSHFVRCSHTEELEPLGPPPARDRSSEEQSRQAKARRRLSSVVEKSDAYFPKTIQRSLSTHIGRPDPDVREPSKSTALIMSCGGGPTMSAASGGKPHSSRQPVGRSPTSPRGHAGRNPKSSRGLNAGRNPKSPRGHKSLYKVKRGFRRRLVSGRHAPVDVGMIPQKDLPAAPKSNKEVIAAPKLPPKPPPVQLEARTLVGSAPAKAKLAAGEESERPGLPRKPAAVTLKKKALDVFDAAQYAAGMGGGGAATIVAHSAGTEAEGGSVSSILQAADTMHRMDIRSNTRGRANAIDIESRPLVPHRPLKGASVPLSYKYDTGKARRGEGETYFLPVSSSGKKAIVTGGTVAALTRNSVDPSSLMADPALFRKVFLHTFLFFELTPEAFLGELLYVYLCCQAEVEEALVPQQEDRPRQKQRQVLEFLHQWMSSDYCFSLKTDPQAISHVRLRLRGFISNTFAPASDHEDFVRFQQLETQLKVIERVASSSHVRKTGDALAADPLATLAPEDLARHITALQFAMLKAVAPSELWNEVWNKQPEAAPNVQQLIQQWNDLSFWLQTRAVAEDSPKARGRLIKYFLKMGAALLQLQNFHGVMAVLSALSSSSIERLKKSWGHVGAKHMSIRQELQDLFDPSSNLKRYRTALRQAQPPCIPFMGTIVNDMTMMGQEPDFVDTPDVAVDAPMVNFAKMWRFSASFDALRRCTSRNYSFPSCERSLRAFLMGLRSESSPERLMSASEIYARSLAVEPRTAGGGAGTTIRGTFGRKTGKKLSGDR